MKEGMRILACRCVRQGPLGKKERRAEQIETKECNDWWEECCKRQIWHQEKLHHDVRAEDTGDQFLCQLRFKIGEHPRTPVRATSTLVLPEYNNVVVLLILL